MTKKVVGVLTGGGDCPGLNPVIRAIVRKGIDTYHFEFLGLRNGWLGLLEQNTLPLDVNAIGGILHRGGTILGTSRTNPSKSEDQMQKAIANFKALGLHALIAIGGDDTLGVASKLHKRGLNLVGVPKTIDNDLSATDVTFGFDTAVQIATEAIDRLHTTAESHNRVMVVEVMGRHAGWIALHSGIAGGADAILIPEVPFTVDDVCNIIRRRVIRGRNFSIVVVAEGAMPKDSHDFVTQSDEKDSFGHVRLGGIGNLIAMEIEKRTGFETRTTILGHIQRGGTPTAFDRVLGTKYGICAIDLVAQGQFGQMASLRGTLVVGASLEEAVSKPKLVDAASYEIARVFSG